MASILKKGNTLYAVYRVNGRQIKRSTQVKDTNKLSRYFAGIVANELEVFDKGGEPNLESVTPILGIEATQALFRTKRTKEQTVEKYFRGWLKERMMTRQSITPAALKSNNRDKTAVEQFLSHLGKKASSMPLKDLKGQEIMLFIKRQRERVSDGTIGIYLNVLSKALNDAIMQDLIQVSPFRQVSFKKRSSTQKKAFTKEQVQILLEYLPKPWKDFVLACLYTGGQRLGDLAMLTWEQISLNHETKGGYIHMIAQKTGNDVSKPIVKPLYEILDERKAMTSGEYVFPIFAEMYQRNGATHISTRFKELLQELGFNTNKKKALGDRRNVSELSFHCLRATAVTMMRNAGVPADLCRVIVGHNSEMIERIYYRPDDTTKLSALNKLDFSI